MTGMDMTTSTPWWLPLLVVLPVAVAYGAGVVRAGRAGVRWSRTNTAAAAAGLAFLTAALMPPLMGATDFRLQIVQHLMLAMLAPLVLALSGPVTLALRTLPRAQRQRLVVVLHSRVVGVLTLGPVVLALEVGGMYLYYLTPLYAQAHQQPWLHILVHVHMFLAGCLLSWYLIGRDPLPRAGWPAKLTVLLVAAAGHDVLAKLMYAHLVPHDAADPDRLRAGAQIMFYGGDAIEILLAVLVMSTWYAQSGRALRHQQRRNRTTMTVGESP
jgi:putative membrane protein